MADGEEFARSALCAGCAAIVTILVRYHFQNLLLVEPLVRVFFYPKPHETKIKRQKWRLIFVADGEGFEPPDELPRQRFSRPSHSTALPTIQNFFRDGSFKPAVLVMRKTLFCSYLASQSRPSLLNRSANHP